MYQLIFTAEAQTDSINAIGNYESKLPGLGKRFKQEIKRQLVALKHNPHTRSVRYDNVGLAVIEKFPYSIHYSIMEQQVIVHAIICDYRNPTEYWVK